MNSIKPDNRKHNALFFLGVLLLGLTYFTVSNPSLEIRTTWTIFLVIAGLLYVALALLNRYIINIKADAIIIKNRLGVFSKSILLNEVAKVKVIDKKYPDTAYRNSLLHLILWDKKFSHFKKVQLLDMFGKILFTIDGQTVDNKDFSKLIKTLKR